jgi:hypothetical protein
VVADPNEADAILNGNIINYLSYPAIFDQSTGRASGIQLSVIMDVKLLDRSGKVLFERNRLEVRGRYEVATDETQYFDESATALERLSRDAARMVVSSMLEAF